MCGITGIFNLKPDATDSESCVIESKTCLSHRGPDDKGILKKGNVTLGHVRLSILDPSPSGHQPMGDPSGRYHIVFNGEIYNFKSLREELKEKGIKFSSQTDTEVLLQLYIYYGSSLLEKLNGFFAFAIFDSQEGKMFLARDRMGIKPLYWCLTENFFCFSSELNSLLAYPVPRQLDLDSLYHYLQLTYIPAPYTILEGVFKLEPGCKITITKDSFKEERWYQIPNNQEEATSLSFEDAASHLGNLLEDSVKKRLVADVPLGTFLSGGIDSSIISMLASRNTSDLNTFSIGFSDDPYFDESKFSSLVAKHLKTRHHQFNISRNEMLESVHEILDSFDEPFADSSSIPLFMLSKLTRKHVKVALSGDGADELFGGYNKHRALLKAGSSNLQNYLLKVGSPVLNKFDGSRNSPFSNSIRKANKYSAGLLLDEKERYWRWATFMGEEEAAKCLGKNSNGFDKRRRKEKILQYLETRNFNQVLYTDMQLVLPNDMLKKVDLMSMANGLEVRCPFLDHRIVEFAFSQPSRYKLSGSKGKLLLRKAFAKDLPESVFNRPKKGFEVPLKNWLLFEMKDYTDRYLNPNFLLEQGIFNPDVIKDLLNRLKSNHPGDTAFHIWSLLVFQIWWVKYLKS